MYPGSLGSIWLMECSLVVFLHFKFPLKDMISFMPTLKIHLYKVPHTMLSHYLRMF